MFKKSNVELTKVHYFEENTLKNVEIPTISKEVSQNYYNSNVVIKRNIFGHTWVLRINENQVEDKKGRCGIKLVVYIWVFCCIIVAGLFGIYYSFDGDYQEILSNTTDFPPKIQQQKITNICMNCTEDEICLKTIEFYLPLCVKIKDKEDPSGCGGLCELKVQRCRKLHKDINIFQCVRNEYVLHCQEGEFNCETLCISREKRCNGLIDCVNMIDEKNCECDLNFHFRCGNETSCLENSKKCNGVVDCWDGEDESDCERDCEQDKYPCINGECIEKKEYCDGVYHCSDRSDEPIGCEK